MIGSIDQPPSMLFDSRSAGQQRQDMCSKFSLQAMASLPELPNELGDLPNECSGILLCLIQSMIHAR